MTDAMADGGDPLELLRSRAYLVVLVLGALIGIPIAAVAYGFLALVDTTQTWVFSSLPTDLGFDTPPIWWPLPPLILAGVIVALAIDRLPGTGGHSPAAGLVSTGAPPPAELPGIVVAAFASLALGAVVGPEAPLIAIGGGLAALIVRTAKRDAPAQALVVIGAAGSFAAVSTLLGSPLLGAFLLMEVAGLAGPMVGVVLVPGLLAAGIGSLVFVGLIDITGWGTFSLAIPDLPPFEQVEAYEFVWAIAVGLVAAVVGTGLKRAAQRLEPVVSARRLLLAPAAGASVALCAIAFAELTDKGTDQVLTSGETALPALLQDTGQWSAGALVLLILAKGTAYCLSLAAFRGGPTFPAMLIGAAGGIALTHLVDGLPPIAGAAMGIGAMTVTLLGLPLTSVLLTTVFLAADELTLLPLIIVAVVVAYVASARLTRPAVASPPAAAP